jgi:hypothetical protein
MKEHDIEKFSNDNHDLFSTSGKIKRISIEQLSFHGTKRILCEKMLFVTA